MVIDVSVTPDFQALGNLSSLGRDLVGWYRVLPNDVVNKINKLLEDKIREDSRNSIGADGSGFQSLSDSYEKRKSREVGSSAPDLRYGYRRGGRAFDSFSIERQGSKNEFRAYFGYGGDYMGAHQDGDDRNGPYGRGGYLPQRKFFPETEDFDSAHYDAFREDVKEILLEYLDDLVQRRLNG